MGFFGSVFAILTLYWQYNIFGIEWALPALVFALISIAAVAVIRLPGIGITPTEAVNRTIMWSSIAEGIGLFLATNIVVNLHRLDLRLPSMALIVGLHFLPIAWVARFRPFYILGSVMILAAALGFIAPDPTGGSIAGAVSALGLWGAAIMGINRDRRVKAQSTLWA
jgi:hypothetical protein